MVVVCRSTYQEWQHQVEALTNDVGVAVLRESGSQLLASFQRFLSPTPMGLTCLLDYVTCSGDDSQVRLRVPSSSMRVKLIDRWRRKGIAPLEH